MAKYEVKKKLGTKIFHGWWWCNIT